MRIWDISLPLQTTTAEWPGDTPFDFRLTWKQSEGASVNVGAISTTVHIGTHADAPFHFAPDGPSVDQLDLAAFLGPCTVVDVRGREMIGIGDLQGEDLAPRVLLQTDAWSEITRFPEQIPVIALDVPAYLKARGVVLLGVDVPSVDRIDSKDLANHHALTACGIRILESLRLADVPAGDYELIALPLKLVGADGAPVRAVLRG